MKSGLMLLYLMAAGAADLKRRRIAVWFLLSGSIWSAGEMLSRYGGESESWISILQKAGMDVLPGVLLLLFAACSGQIGSADGWMVLNIGLYEGWQRGLLTLGLGLFLMVISIPFLFILHPRKKMKYYKLPCLVYFAAAYLIGCGI